MNTLYSIYIEWVLKTYIFELFCKKIFPVQGQGVLPVRFVGLSFWGWRLVSREATQDQESQGFRYEYLQISGILLRTCSETTSNTDWIHILLARTSFWSWADWHRELLVLWSRCEYISLNFAVKAWWRNEVNWTFLGTPSAWWSCLCSEDHQKEAKTQQPRRKGTLIHI